MATTLIDQEVYWYPRGGVWVRVLERKRLFGRETAKVLVEGRDQVLTVSAEALQAEPQVGLQDVLTTVAGARIWHALGSDLFLAPLVSKVLPLPHQFRVLRRVMGGFPVRMMLADEVGMGKTIEAGLVLKEMKLRGMIERVLILAPKSLMLQWIAEMDTLFDEDFELVLPGDWNAGVTTRSHNEWKRYDQVITSMDSVKPKSDHRGWSDEKIARYNLERFHDLVHAGWDLVIIDEAHKVAGASEDVARHELARELSKAAPHLLLLTATPHSGKSDAFRRLLSLLDPATFEAGAPLTRTYVEPIVVRTEKRTATDADGKPLFAPRQTKLVEVPLDQKHALQQALYEAVSEYVIEGYNRAERTGDKGYRLLLILIQRLVSSSTRAVRRFLERRLEVLDGIVNQAEGFDDAELEEAVQAALFKHDRTREREEMDEVRRLLSLAQQVEQAGPDARTEALLDHMIQIAREDGEPSKKYLVFTEFTATQDMLQEFLEQRGYTVATLNGTMDLEERKAAQEAFRADAQLLISTDAGGEGLNMQFAHVVFNYDLPWAPMRVEQRIGRVDRIGQKRPVKAINLVLENSVEARVYEVWQEKLATILEEYGVDKTGDILDSGEADVQFERLARTALLNPDALEHEFDRMVTEIRRIADEGQRTKALYSNDLDAADRIPTVPLRSWLDTLMGADQGSLFVDEVDLSEVVVQHINELRSLFAEGKPVPILNGQGLGFDLDGWFGIWRIGIADGAWRQQRVFATFTADDGTSYGKSAQRLWDEISTRQLQLSLNGTTTDYVIDVLRSAAEEASESIFESVVTKTQERTERRLRALDVSYLARRGALSKIGLPAVREARRRELEAEYERKKGDFTLAAEALPDLDCLFLARISAR